MTELEKLQKKRREAAAKLKKPTPRELPSGAWRCEIMYQGRRLSVVDEDPEVAHAKVNAMKLGLVDAEKRKDRKIPTTLEIAIDNYVALKEGALSPSTIRGYETIKKNRFTDLMQRNIYELTKADVQAAVSAEAKKVSAKTVYNAYGLVRPVLKEYGVDVFGVKLPQRIKPSKQYLQPEDVGKLIEAVQGDSCEAAILIAVWLGLRRSEIIGLCWDCVDFEAGTIAVRRSYVPNKDNKWVLKDGAKNVSSQRTVPCPSYIMDKLRELPRKEPGERVFKMVPDTLRRHIHAACKRAGITDTTVHGLRHTNAAVMKSLGIDDAHAMARGGWTDESTYKRTYSYVFEQQAKSDDAKIDEYFSNLRTNSARKNEDT